MKRITKIIMAVVFIMALAGCAGGKKSAAADVADNSTISESASKKKDGTSDDLSTESEEETETILLAAAASLEYSFKDELIPLFQEKYPNIKVEATYDSSGKLQTQIEEGLDADVFMSASAKQMDALNEGGFIKTESITELLENRIVLITHADSDTAIDSFEKIGDAETIALGDPESVPVGQYAEEALTNLGIYDKITPKVSFGTNVTEVLSWVSEGSADVGIVYATDAATTDKVKIIANSPEGCLSKKVIYPVGLVSKSSKEESADIFIEFLKTPEALEIFSSYGFTPNI